MLAGAGLGQGQAQAEPHDMPMPHWAPPGMSHAGSAPQVSPDCLCLTMLLLLLLAAGTRRHHCFAALRTSALSVPQGQAWSLACILHIGHSEVNGNLLVLLIDFLSCDQPRNRCCMQPQHELIKFVWLSRLEGDC